MPQSISAEDYRLRNGFEAVRRQLLDARLADRLDRSLGYWAIAADRRLPLALLDHSLREILQMPFERLAATPGIGRKKLGSLIMLLQRATDDPGAPLPPPPSAAFESPAPVEPPPPAATDPFDAATVSETMWEQWCETVRRHDLKRERLGRLAPSLLDLPTVIWNTPLSDYLSQSLQQIRKRRTHGEKRVRVVLELFHALHRLLSPVGPHHRLSLRLMPRFISPIEDWLAELAVRDNPPDEAEIRQSLAMPLLNQIAVDGGPVVHKLAEGRLGIDGPPQSVRHQARRLGVTRARVYQLLESCNKILEVRWPEGRISLSYFAERFRAQGADSETLRLFEAIRELAYPDKFPPPAARSARRPFESRFSPLADAPPHHTGRDGALDTIPSGNSTGTSSGNSSGAPDTARPASGLNAAPRFSETASETLESIKPGETTGLEYARAADEPTRSVSAG